MRALRYVLVLTPILLALACTQDDRTGDLFDGHGGPGDGADGDGGGSDGPGEGSGSGGGDEGDDIKYDVGGTGSPVDPDDEVGCEKADFLFVIDASQSMGDAQENIAVSAPGFIAAIREQVEIDDINILVADADNVWATSTCGTSTPDCDFMCEQFPTGACRQGDVEISCTPPPDPCDETRGAGRNADSMLQLCGTPEDLRYIEVEDEPDLAGRFACLANVGPYGGCVEKPMESMVAAVSSDLNEAGGCHAGFLRRDAVLIATFITDAADQSTGDPTSWHQALVTAKNGYEESVVVLGIFDDGTLCANTDAEPDPRLETFVESWGERGHVASVCEPNYAPFFQSAIASIDWVCDNFVPPAG